MYDLVNEETIGVSPLNKIPITRNVREKNKSKFKQPKSIQIDSKEFNNECCVSCT